MSRASFCFEDHAVAVEAGDPSSLIWLSEFLGPAFETADRAPTEGLVRLRTDEDERRSLGQYLRSHAQDERPFFALDSKLLQYPVSRRGAQLIAWDEKYDCCYVLGASSVEIVAGADSRKGRFALMRVVRELITQRAVRAPGRVQLHAACAATGGRAVAFAGPKGTGKTTLLIDALEAHGAGYVANDRLFVTVRDGAVEARGVPTSVSVRPKTLELAPRLARALPDVRSVSHLTLAEAGAELAAHGPRDPARRVTLSSALLTSVLGAEAIPSAPLYSLVFVEQAEAAQRSALELLAPDAALVRLAACRYALDTEPRPLTELERWAGFHEIPPPPPEATLRALVSRVRCYRYQVGRRGEPGRGEPGRSDAGVFLRFVHDPDPAV